MMREPYAVILAGGRGERFWPYSTEENPKQLMALIGGRTLLAQTVERLAGIVSPDRIFIITSERIVPRVRELLPDLPAAHIVAEPCGRNTAAAIALAAGIIRTHDPEAVFGVFPSDHLIADAQQFRATLSACFEAAAQHDTLITIGIRATWPSTGYGYIETGSLAFEVGAVRFLKAERFVEKPDAERANQYVAAGRYFWNAGMFVWSLRSLEMAFGRFRPDFARFLRDVAVHATQSLKLQAFLKHEYARVDNISIDYALMEKADNIVMTPGDFGWDDVGTWDSLGTHLPEDEHGNAVVGSAELLDAANNTVISENHLTALIGVRDLVIVQAKGVTLICPKNQAERVKELVGALRRSGRWNHLL